MKKILPFLIITLFLLSFSGLVFAQSQLANQTLFNNVKLVVTWTIGIAALLAAIVFAVGAIELMFFSNQEGKERMLGAVIGLVLCLSSIIIIRTINPAIINPLHLTALPSQGGVYLEKANGDKSPAAFYFQMDKTIVDGQYTGIYYDCTKLDPNKTMRLLISVTKKPLNANDYSDTSVSQIACGNRLPLPPPLRANDGSWAVSISITFETPGVYFYTDAGCHGQFTGPYLSTTSLPNFYSNNVKGIIFAFGDISNQNFNDVVVAPWWNPDPTKAAYWCNTSRLTDVAQGTCIPITGNCENATESAWIIYKARDPRTAGNGINFYSEPTGWNWNAGQNGGQDVGEVSLSTDQISTNGVIDPATLVFQYPNPNPDNPDQKAYQDRCKTFADCPESIQVNGNYSVVLYATNQKDNTWRQIFTTDVNDLGQQEIFQKGNNKFTQIQIIPTTSP